MPPEGKKKLWRRVPRWLIAVVIAVVLAVAGTYTLVEVNRPNSEGPSKPPFNYGTR